MTTQTLLNQLLRMPARDLCALAASLGVAHRSVPSDGRQIAQLKATLAAKIVAVARVYYARPADLGGMAHPCIAFCLVEGLPRAGYVPVLRAPSARFCFALRAVMLLLVLFGAAVGLRAQDASHVIRLQDMALAAPGSAGVPTHVVLEGTVELNRRERDGDRHLRICAAGLCIVAECIPELPWVEKVCATARKGDQVWVTGITRFDPNHGRHTPADTAKYGQERGWWELHPVLSLEVK